MITSMFSKKIIITYDRLWCVYVVAVITSMVIGHDNSILDMTQTVLENVFLHLLVYRMYTQGSFNMSINTVKNSLLMWHKTAVSK